MIGTIIAASLLIIFVSFPLLSGLVAPLVPDRVQEPVGAAMVESVANEYPMCSGEEGLAALESLAGRLAATSEADETKFRIFVSSDEMLNAFAAPGGYIVIYRSIIDSAEGPDEVAGVLAHEMGHLVEDHPAKGLVEALGYGAFGLLVPMSDGESAVIAKTLLTTHYSRDDELEADEVGVALLNEAGIDSRGLIAFFERLQANGNEIRGALEFLSTHPSGDTRTKRLQDKVVEGSVALDEKQWAALQNICESTGTTDPIEVGG